ncbi:MAG: hydrogenase nickel incorporation protein HypB [Halothiobacillaceae bacterium]
MCDTCGCNITPGNRHLVELGGRLSGSAGASGAIEVLHGLLDENNHQAAHNRAHFDQRGILAVNLMSSPGSGKTALLESTIEALRSEMNLAVVVGDLETENDARRLRRHGVDALQIATGSACHLDAHMVHDALHELDLGGLDIVFIENVGNLVCPASFDLGQHANVVLLATTEGDDKPAKYPVMFRAADLVLLSKADLLPVLDDFEPRRAEAAVRQLASDAPVTALSATRGQGMEFWLDWLRGRLAAHRQTHPKSEAPAHHHHHHHHGGHDHAASVQPGT